MTRQEIFEKLEEIFRDIFDDDNLVVNDETNATDIEGWDSLRQVSLLVAAENVFHIRLAISDTRNLQNVGALVDIIEQKIQK